MTQGFLQSVLIFILSEKIVSVNVLKPRGGHFVCLQADDGEVVPSAQCMQMNWPRAHKRKQSRVTCHIE